MTPEAIIQNRSMVAVSKAGALIFRNPVGNGWVGQFVSAYEKNGERFTVLKYATRTAYGLQVGSGDGIGLTPVTITDAHIGRKLGVFLSLEFKTEKGRIRPEQLIWQENIRRVGGIAEIVRSEDEAVEALKV